MRKVLCGGVLAGLLSVVLPLTAEAGKTVITNPVSGTVLMDPAKGTCMRDGWRIVVHNKTNETLKFHAKVGGEWLHWSFAPGAHFWLTWKENMFVANKLCWTAETPSLKWTKYQHTPDGLGGFYDSVTVKDYTFSFTP